MTNFLWAAGTNGFTTTPFTVLTTELNAITNGSLATLGAAKTQSDTGNALWGYIYFKSGGSFTPSGAPSFSIWFITSGDGGSNYEKNSAAPPRSPDAVIQLATAAYASGDLVFASGLIRLWAPTTKILLQNNSGVTLPATTNTLTVGPVSVSY